MAEKIYTLNGILLPRGVNEIRIAQPGFERQTEYAMAGNRMIWAGPKDDKSILIKGTSDMGDVTESFLAEIENMAEQPEGIFTLTVLNGPPDRMVEFDHASPPVWSASELTPGCGHYNNFELRLWRIS